MVSNKKTKLLPLSKVKDTDQFDSVAQAKKGNEYYRALDILYEAEQHWRNMRTFRERRQRCKRFNYGDQWGDYIEVHDEQGHRWITQEQYIKEQGSIPLKQNLIRRLVKNILGVYRSQQKEPTCTARDKDEQKLGETMSVALQYNRQLNHMSELDTRMMEEFLISGAAIQVNRFGWRGARCDNWTENVSPDEFIIDSDMRDPRGWDCHFVGQIHDLTMGVLLNKFGKSLEDIKTLKELYNPQTYMTRVVDTFLLFGEDMKTNKDFYLPENRTLCRVYEIWKKEQKTRIYCHDWNDGSYYKVDAADYQEMVVQENEKRIKECLDLGFDEKDIPLIEVTEERVDDYWYYYFITPTGHILEEGESPYCHHEHPYTFKFYPFIDGETHSFVEDIIDQQVYVNRLITLYDWILRASAKGMLLVPEDCKADNWSWEDYADEWSRFNGMVVYKPSKSGAVPTQISSNSTNIGIGDLLSLQLKFFEDISGVQGALQGKVGSSGVSGSLYAQQVQNATMSLLDILETFSSFVVDGAYKVVQNIQQFYDQKRMFNIVGRAGRMVEYNPEKIRDVQFDLSITESTATPVYRQLANDFLMQIWSSGQIDLEQLLATGDFPFGDELLQNIKVQKEAAEKRAKEQTEQAQAQAEAQQSITPAMQQQLAQQINANPRAAAMFEQALSGRGINPSMQSNPLAVQDAQSNTPVQAQ